jgi:hypothetical protein
LKGLVLEGNPPEFAVQTAFMDIYSEYVDICMDADTAARVKLMNEIVALEARIYYINLIIPFLYMQPEPEYIEYFRKLGYSWLQFPLNWDEPKNYVRDLEGIKTRSGQFSLTLALKKEELAALTAAQKGEAPTRKYFEYFIINLSDHCGYQLREDKMTVLQFAIRKANMQKYIKEMERRSNQNKRKYGR